MGSDLRYERSCKTQPTARPATDRARKGDVPYSGQSVKPILALPASRLPDAAVDHHRAGHLEHLSQLHQLSRHQTAEIHRIDQLGETGEGYHVLGVVP